MPLILFPTCKRLIHKVKKIMVLVTHTVYKMDERVLEWQSVIAVLLNVGSCVFLIKPA